jgi:predicted membrane channel-forming protein YqfA (hemolysin III family)
VNVKALLRQHSALTLITAAFVIALIVTAAYWAGLVPGIPKTLPTFVYMAMGTVGLLALTVVAWAMTLLVQLSKTEPD